MKVKGRNYHSVWMEGNIVHAIDQTRLPFDFRIVKCHNINEISDAIRSMVVRGAPAIGAFAAYGIAQAIIQSDNPNFFTELYSIESLLKNSRPTAKDLFTAIDFMKTMISKARDLDEAKQIALKASREYASISVNQCRKIGEYGEPLIKDKANILTHCNAGALATVDIGTALAPIRLAHNNRKDIFVYVDETRPRLQGAKLTAFELREEGIPYAVIADNAAGYYMSKGLIDLVIVGADRVALNGDIANKIGTYEKAVLAEHNSIPFYVAAPSTTIDLDLKSGKDIVIEQRNPEEISYVDGDKGRVKITADPAMAKNPAFDITPAGLITGIITDKGIVKPSDIMKLVKHGRI